MPRNSVFRAWFPGPHPRPEVRYDVPVTAENVKNIFGDCADFELRQVWPGGRMIAGVTACWLDGVISGSAASEDVIRPLTDPQRLGGAKTAAACMELLLRGAVYSYSVKERRTMDDVVNDLVMGFTAILFDAEKAAVTFETKSAQTRSVGEPTVEKTVKGAKDAFVETLRVNTSLVRRKLRDPDLKIVQTTVGRKTGTTVALLYLDGVANPDTVAELRRRLDAIDIDGLTAAGNLEQYITDAPASPFPQLLHTERPDKFAAELLAGRVGVIPDGLPMGFLLPAPMADFLRVADDRGGHFITASLLRLLRWVSLLLTILLPALLVDLTAYHHEMIPTKLLLSIIDAKQKVPFSVSIEVLVMLLSFELLQEAGLRLPNPVGDTVSIIGALIVGQAAVEAKVVSPVSVIVVATAGICGFTLPSQDMNAALRVVRLGLVILSIAMGMFGTMLGLALLIWLLSSMDSFGVSYTSPLSDRGFFGSLKAFVQLPLWKLKFRDQALKPGDRRCQR